MLELSLCLAYVRGMSLHVLGKEREKTASNDIKLMGRPVSDMRR
jgi:hypothetical protein